MNTDAQNHPDDSVKTFIHRGKIGWRKTCVAKQAVRAISGQYITFEWTAKAIKDEDVVFFVARDISDT